ncbi:adhesin [Moraxella haemolytica]|uniref:ACP-like domain-containing protein n=1 Tax=Moraxella TaxID=475 RepID=UPI0025436752|nr:adhesin [Moraxella sp. ZY171148]WII95311.1 adhesin [Moraxella sp. ZY171148]
MKALKTIAPVLALGLAFAGTAHAQTMDARQADATATKVRQVTYQCNAGGRVTVNFGFNKHNLPTFAEARLGGKTRFLPINLSASDNVDTNFGDENSWNISTDALTLNNYHKSSLMVQDSDSSIAYKNCRVVSTKRIKG